MKELHFTYKMQIDYSVEVSKCYFTIKCIPKETLRQNIENIRISLFPETAYQWGTDGFKNKQIWGEDATPHTQFVFEIEGDVHTGLAEYEEDIDTDLAMVFGHPYGLNKAGETIRKFYKEKIEKKYSRDTNTYDKTLEIMHMLFQKYTYKTGSTNVDTTAEDAFAQGCGVCQDYSHILISLLHLSGIEARYVTGFIIGEGQSHAWVEVLFDGKWFGIDPTHDRAVNDDYIKLCHGRDAKDCMINRGIMRGGGVHTQSVIVNVSEV